MTCFLIGLGSFLSLQLALWLYRNWDDILDTWEEIYDDNLSA